MAEHSEDYQKALCSIILGKVSTLWNYPPPPPAIFGKNFKTTAKDYKRGERRGAWGEGRNILAPKRKLGTSTVVIIHP
jgi:hypothetical protein